MKHGWDFADANRLVRGSWICRFFQATINRIEAALQQARVVRFCRECAREFTELPSRRQGALVVSFIVAAVLAQGVLRMVTPIRLLPVTRQLMSLDVVLGALATLLWIARQGSARRADRR